MYEHYLTAFENGVTGVDISIDEEEFGNDSEIQTREIGMYDDFTITVTFAVHTDSEAWITIDGHGVVHPAFGGTGTSLHELNRYAEQAVRIWRAITGDNATTCRYNTPRSAHDDSTPEQEVINA